MRANESLRVLADADELARAAADLVLARACEALAARDAFHLALSGGSTPRRAYQELAARLDARACERWHVWFSDERCVPPDHEASNHRMARESGFLARFPPENVHRMRGEAPDPHVEAERYEHELTTTLGVPPRLDLVLLGLGTDGHVASLFPGTPALEAWTWVTVGHAPSPPTERLTLTSPALAQARALVFLVSGPDKRAALKTVFTSSAATDLPARRACPMDGDLVWLVDRAAAGELTARTGRW